MSYCRIFTCDDCHKDSPCVLTYVNSGQSNDSPPNVCPNSGEKVSKCDWVEMVATQDN